MRHLPLTIALACLPLAGGSAAVRAETLEELDALSDAAVSETGGILAARDAAGRGEYLDALAMLERMFGAFPRSAEGLLLHAQYLCAIDDRQGGLVELQLLRERDYTGSQLADARTTCTTTAPRPAPEVITAPEPRAAAETRTPTPMQSAPPPPSVAAPVAQRAPTQQTNSLSSASSPRALEAPVPTKPKGN